MQKKPLSQTQVFLTQSLEKRPVKIRILVKCKSMASLKTTRLPVQWPYVEKNPRLYPGMNFF